MFVLAALGGETDVVLRWIFPDKTEDLLPPEKDRKKLKKFCEWLLIFGIVGEIGCLPFSLYGTASAENEAGQANLQVGVLSNATVQLSANLEKAKSDNLKLATQVFGLATQTEQISTNIA